MTDTAAYRSALCALLLLGLALLLPACVAKPDETWTFLLPSATRDVGQVSERLIGAVFAELRESGSLDEGYPVLGRIELEPDPSDPGVQRMRCVPGPSAPPAGIHCILLNGRGDFVTAQAITWASAAHYMYRVYVAPTVFARVDSSRGFVALDVFLLEEEALWQAVDEAIREAVAQTGAWPFRP